jgi:hypothetical protein
MTLVLWTGDFFSVIMWTIYTERMGCVACNKREKH